MLRDMQKWKNTIKWLDQRNVHFYMHNFSLSPIKIIKQLLNSVLVGYADF